MYKDRGFEILSLSFDSGAENVRKFRAGKWPMPWLHTFVTDGFASETAKSFEVGYLPKLVLVDRSGTILAAFHDELSGTALHKTLDRTLERETQAK